MPKHKLQVRYFHKGQQWIDAGRGIGAAVAHAESEVTALLEKLPSGVLAGGHRTVHITDGIGSGWEYRLVVVEPTKEEKIADIRFLLNWAGIKAGNGVRAAFCSGVLGRNVLEGDPSRGRGWRIEDLSDRDVDRVLEAARKL